MEVPDYSEHLKVQCAGQLMSTIQRLCNESELSRAEILGALEAVKLSLFTSWQEEAQDDEEDD